MLLEFGAKNFFSFKEGFEISFRLNENCPKKVSKGRDHTNILCVKGANGSGKTNVIKALGFISDFSVDSFNQKPDSEFAFSPFFDNDSEPTSFYIEFKIDDEEYHYAFDLFKSHVASEKLILNENDILFERASENLLKASDNFKDLKTIKIRKNASVISTANQYDIGAIKPIYDFLHSFRYNVNQRGLKDFFVSEQILLRHYFENPERFEFVKDILKEFDLGIDNILIEKNENILNENMYEVKFIHKVEGREKKLPLVYQSSGTKTLFEILVRYKIALENSGILALDEFDNKLHPAILPKLVLLFEDTESNPHDSQFIFTTHNEKIMDQLGKYRTVLVNKKDNESFLYRLDEIPGEIIRNDRKISPLYESGKIGGVPKL